MERCPARSIGFGAQFYRHTGIKADALERWDELTVNSVAGAVAAAEAGLGVANLLSYQVAEAVAAGRLIAVLNEQGSADPISVSLLFDSGRAAMPSVRAFIEAMKNQAITGHWH